MSITLNSHGKVVTTQEAQVKTATVEVKVLTLSGKQMTLAVFRQLKEEQIVGASLELFGIPWGTVNYHPSKGCGLKGHVHVVWQKGDELRRCAVYSTDGNVAKNGLHDWIRRSVEALYGWCQRSEDRNVTATLPAAFHTPPYTGYSDTPDYFMRRVEMWGLDIPFSIKHPKCPADGYDPLNALRMLQQDIELYRSMETNWEKSWKTISDLDQLFIAV